MIGHGRHDAMLQNLDSNHILHANAHGVAGKAFGVGDNDVVGRRAEGMAQGHYFGRRAATASRGKGFVGHKDQFSGHCLATDTETTLNGRYQIIHHAGNVIHIQPGAMVGTVAAFTAEQFDDATHPPLTHRILALKHHGAGPHAQNRAVAAPVEGNGRLCYLVIGSGCTQGQKAGPHPLQQIVAGHVVGRDHDDAAAATAANPVFGNGHRLGRAGTGGVDLGVGSAGADVFGKLAVAHGQNAEKKAAVENVRGFSQLGP